MSEETALELIVLQQFYACKSRLKSQWLYLVSLGLYLEINAWSSLHGQTCLV